MKGAAATLFDTASWQMIRDGHPGAMALFRQHYSFKTYLDNRTRNRFVGPGERIVLLSHCGRALFVWRKFRSLDNQQGVNCSVFRNENPTLKSSELILEAEAIAQNRWPGERMYTYVNPRAVASPNPGYCFKVAGWQVCGVTQVHKLLILEKLPNQPS